jgi:hypothetical protein
LEWAFGPRNFMRNRLADVAHALLPAASALLPTPARCPRRRGVE